MKPGPLFTVGFYKRGHGPPRTVSLDRTHLDSVLKGSDNRTTKKWVGYHVDLLLLWLIVVYSSPPSINTLCIFSQEHIGVGGI